MNDTPGEAAGRLPVRGAAGARIPMAVARVIDRLERVSYETLLSTPARIFVAMTFWLSGRTKVDGSLSVNQTAFFLFEHEFALPLISPRFAAYLTTYAEHLFPLLLIVGLASRLSATALLVMTAMIQFFVYPGAWATHLLWAVMLVFIIFRGPGALAADHLVRKRYMRS